MSDLPKRLFLSTRPMFFPASVVPVLVGTAWGGPQVNWAIFLIALLGMMCLHAGANVLNDVGDELSGCDRANTERISPFTGGSRFIQDGLLTVRQMAIWGGALLAFAAGLGAVLVVWKGLAVLALGGLGVALAIAYSLRPFSLAGRGWGELAVGVAFTLPVGASGWLQSGVVSPQLVLASLAVGCWSAAILIVNEVPDLTSDALTGKRTLVVRLGRQRTVWLYAAVQILSAFMLLGVAGAIWTYLPPLVLLAVVAAVAPKLRGGRDDQLTAIRATLAIHLLGGIWLMVLAWI